MNEIIKNMFRRKTRTLLTIFGITIGIFAFVVMGSMAEKISLLVNGGTRYYSDKVTVAEGTGGMAMPLPMNITKADILFRPSPDISGAMKGPYKNLTKSVDLFLRRS